MERRLSAILAADMVGYSRLMEVDEIGTLQRQKLHRSHLIDPNFNKFHGRIVKEMGDGILVEFPSVVEAVQCSVAIQRGIVEREVDISQDRQIQYRIGINLGDIVIEDSDIFGDGVNIAARLEQMAEPGGICISGTAYDQLKSKVEVGYESLGDVRVKNIQQAIRAYKVLTEPDQVGVDIGKRKTSTEKIVGLVAISGALFATLIGVGWWWSGTSEVGAARIVAVETDAGENHLAGVDDLTVAPSGKSTIAILPFVNMSTDPQQDYFSDGMTEDLITDWLEY